MSQPVVIGNATLYHGDCLEILPTLPRVDAVVTDPPYGMGKFVTDTHVPVFLPLIADTPTACFCGVRALHDYPTPQWIGAWVRPASTQRNGALRGFNNWEPILFYGMPSLDNDVITEANIHEDTGHPTTKPIRLMRKLVAKMPAGTILDPFMGSGTTGVACMSLGRKFIGIEIEKKYFDIACERIDQAQRQARLFA